MYDKGGSEHYTVYSMGMCWMSDGQCMYGRHYIVWRGKNLTYPFSESSWCVLRLLVTQGWFCEPSQGYFTNNRLSNLIKKDQAIYHHDIATYMLVFSRSSYTIATFLFSYCFKEILVFSPKLPQAFQRWLIIPDSRYRVSKEHESFPYCLSARFQQPISHFLVLVVGLPSIRRNLKLLSLASGEWP
jgi:hypothetical protein